MKEGLGVFALLPCERRRDRMSQGTPEMPPTSPSLPRHSESQLLPTGLLQAHSCLSRAQLKCGPDLITSVSCQGSGLRCQRHLQACGRRWIVLKLVHKYSEAKRRRTKATQILVQRTEGVRSANLTAAGVSGAGRHHTLLPRNPRCAWYPFSKWLSAY